MATLNNEYFANVWNPGIVKLQRVTVNCSLPFVISHEEPEFNFGRNLPARWLIGHYTAARCLNRQYVRFYSRIVHSTNCSLLHRSKSHSKETQESKIMANVIGGISSSTAKNAEDQWQLRLPCTANGHLGVLYHRSFEGYCENIPQGTVRVKLWVGQCSSGHTLGDAYTGWQSVSRIMIEEVSRSQS